MGHNTDKKLQAASNEKLDTEEKLDTNEKLDTDKKLDTDCAAQFRADRSYQNLG